ncbi:MAG: gamma-glutamylcyclotransferase family protein [Pseudomonadota bacterium]
MSFSVFGYGSLVNRGTLPSFVSARPLAARGWRRAWRCISRGKFGGRCALSVVPDPDSAIEGLVLTFEDDAWPLIRAREHNYDPLHLADDPDVLIFRVQLEKDRYGDRDHPICLSYIDTTLQGFVQEFGEDGARRFMATTDGWSVPILDDRHDPTYPRAQKLSSAEQNLIDELLMSVDAVPARPQEV